MRFYAELAEFLPLGQRGREFTLEYPTGGAVKDLIEGLGVPHTEVDLILANGESVDFKHRIAPGDRVSVYPVFEGFDIATLTLVRPRPLRVTRFVADVHLGRLAAYLRLCGFDTLYRNDWQDEELVKVSGGQRRILLTRDRGLLKRAAITHAYLVREQRPRSQLAEVLARFDLRAALRPLSRCSVCNTLVRPVTKDRVAASLPPRTAAHHDEFWECSGCGRVYWKGAHYEALLGLMSSGRDGGDREAPAPE